MFGVEVALLENIVVDSVLGQQIASVGLRLGVLGKQCHSR